MPRGDRSNARVCQIGGWVRLLYMGYDQIESLNRPKTTSRCGRLAYHWPGSPY